MEIILEEVTGLADFGDNELAVDEIKATRTPSGMALG